jgi:hypothetical protein
MLITKIVKKTTRYSVILQFYNKNSLIGNSNYSIHKENVATINNLEVKSEYRKQGFGYKILNLTEKEIIRVNSFRLKQINLIAYEIDNKEGGLVDFFQRNGYYNITTQSFRTFDDGLTTYNLIPMVKFFNYREIKD